MRGFQTPNSQWLSSLFQFSALKNGNKTNTKCGGGQEAGRGKRSLGRELGRKARLGRRLICGTLGGGRGFIGLAPFPPELGNMVGLGCRPHVSSHFSGSDKPEARAQPAGQVQGGSERLREAEWREGGDFPQTRPVGSSQSFFVICPGQRKATASLLHFDWTCGCVSQSVVSGSF